ncbi:hypothetical protein BpHYR1_007481 [Brachionus plicatilis]|uniref:Uncharacterized protein n=1 Tax=Brachionus plicatilis TaxID=10195 RepID=A0A3M7RP93_BRAPC|nr:hypothetical protein BpHYR1_007481 [Brachionus plicatilis]
MSTKLFTGNPLFPIKQIYIDHYNLSTLNFNHHKEIINDFSTLRKQNELDNNDINGNFYVLPNDDINLTNSAFSKLINSKNILKHYTVRNYNIPNILPQEQLANLIINREYVIVISMTIVYNLSYF